jgi:hypothetical protein
MLITCALGIFCGFVVGRYWYPITIEASFAPTPCPVCDQLVVIPAVTFRAEHTGSIAECFPVRPRIGELGHLASDTHTYGTGGTYQRHENPWQILQ